MTKDGHRIKLRIGRACLPVFEVSVVFEGDSKIKSCPCGCPAVLDRLFPKAARRLHGETHSL